MRMSLSYKGSFLGQEFWEYIQYILLLVDVSFKAVGKLRGLDWAVQIFF